MLLPEYRSVRHRRAAGYRLGYLYPHLDREVVKDASVMTDVFCYIESLYHRTRRHGHLGRISPEAFESAVKCGRGVFAVAGEVHPYLLPEPLRYCQVVTPACGHR